MLDPSQNLSELKLHAVREAPFAGTVLFIGRDLAALKHIVENIKVTLVIHVPGEGPPIRVRSHKVHTVNQPIEHLQRRDLGVSYVDFLYVSGEEVFDSNRLQTIRRLVKEFRPKGTCYAWQEIDILAEYIGQGGDFDTASIAMFGSFLLTTGITATPVSIDYARHCISVVQELTWVKRREATRVGEGA